MFCASCGKDLTNHANASFCPYCGAPISAAAGRSTADSGIPTFVPPTDAAGSKTLPTFQPPEGGDEPPVFRPPDDDIPQFRAPGGGSGRFCHYHEQDRAVGECARCGKSLCQDCCDSYGVTGGEYAGKHLCYECTQQIVADNVAELTKNKHTIMTQFIISLVGIVIGFIVGIGEGGGFVGGFICACIGGVFLGALKAFWSLTWEAIKIAFSGNFGIITVISLIFNVLVIIAKCIWTTVTNTIKYIIYLKKTSGFIETDTQCLQQMKDHMEYTLIRMRNRNVSLDTLMQGELANNSFAHMVHDEGEEAAEANMRRCVTRIAENGEIIRSFEDIPMAA